MLMCIQNLVKFCPLVLKILSGNEILRSIKGRNSVTNFRNLTLYSPNLDLNHNSVANLQKLTLYNPNLDPINVNVYTKFGKILSIGSQDIERKQNSDINQGP